MGLSLKRKSVIIYGHFKSMKTTNFILKIKLTRKRNDHTSENIAYELESAEKGILLGKQNCSLLKHSQLIYLQLNQYRLYVNAAKNIHHNTDMGIVLPKDIVFCWLLVYMVLRLKPTVSHTQVMHSTLPLLLCLLKFHMK